MPLIVTFLIGLWRVSVPELWRDEIASWSVETRSLSQLFQLLGHSDAVSGAYYLLMHFWTDLAGTSPLALRLPSILAMAGAAAFTALAGEQLMTRSAGIVAGLVFAGLPTVSRFAQEARPYALTVLAVSVASWLVLRAADAPERGRGWVGYGISMFVVGAFNLVALCVLVGHVVLVLMRTQNRREALTRWLSAVAIAVVALTPLMVEGMHQAHDQIGWVRPPTWGSLARIGPQLAGGLLVALIMVIAAITAVARNRRLGLALLSQAVLPILLVLLISLVGSASYWIARYLVFTLPAWCLLAAAATERWAWPVSGLAVAAVAFGGISGQIAVRTPLAHNWASYPYPAASYPGPPGIDYRRAARVIASEFQPGDGVIGAHDQYDAIDLAMAYYLPSWVRPQNVFVLRSPAELGSFYPSVQPHPTIADIRLSRLWVVTVGQLADPPRHLTSADRRFLDRCYRLQATTQVARDTFVQLYVRREPSSVVMSSAACSCVAAGEHPGDPLLPASARPSAGRR